jgi:hypothetical protein
MTIDDAFVFVLFFFVGLWFAHVLFGPDGVFPLVGKRKGKK